MHAEMHLTVTRQINGLWRAHWYADLRGDFGRLVYKTMAEAAAGVNSIATDYVQRNYYNANGALKFEISRKTFYDGAAFQSNVLSYREIWWLARPLPHGVPDWWKAVRKGNA